MQVYRQYLYLILAGVSLFFHSLFSGFGQDICSLELDPDDDLFLDETDERRAQAFAKFGWGLLLEFEGESSPEKVEEFYVSALRTMPESLLLFRQIVYPWIEQGDHRRVAEILQPIARQNPQLPHLQLTAASALRELGRYAEAIDLLEYADQAIRPRSPRLLRELAAVLWQAERYSELEQLLLKIDREPDLSDNFDAEHIAAVFFQALADEPESSDFHPSQIKRFRQSALKHARRAAGLINKDINYSDFEQLFTILQQAEDWHTLEKTLSRARQLFDRQEIDLSFKQVAVRQQQGRTAEAIELLEELAEQTTPDYAAHFRIGQAYLELDVYDKADKYLSSAFSQQRDSISIRFLLAYVKNLKGEYPKAFSLLEDIDSDMPFILLVRSQTALGMGRNEEAGKWAQKAAAQAEKIGMENFFTPEFFLYQAMLYEKTDDFDRMLELAEKAYEISPDCPIVQNFLGYTLADQKIELNRAEKLIKAAVRSKPDNVAIRDSLAWIYYRQKRFPEALLEINRTLQLARRKNYMDKVIYSHAGDIYAASNYPRLAVYYWRLAISMNSREQDELRRKIDRTMELIKNRLFLKTNGLLISGFF